MAMTRVEPVAVRVRTDWLSGRPREIQWGERTIPVIGIASVRRERSAYPVEIGPRTTFEVDTPGMRVALTFRHRGRRWLVEGLDPDVAQAA